MIFRLVLTLRFIWPTLVLPLMGTLGVDATLLKSTKK